MNGNSILESAVLLRLEFKKAGNSRKADKTAIQTDCDKDSLKVSKVLFDSEQFAAIGKFDSALREWVVNRCLTVNVGFSGVYILPVALLDSVEKRLAVAADERAALVQRFLEVYDDERGAARVRLADQFRDADYPVRDMIAGQFGLAWRYVTFDVPDKLPPEVLERERAARAESFANMENECRSALRVGLLDLVEHLATSLQVGADGKPKIFRDSAVGNVVEFLELIEARDITKDDELRKAAGKAREIIASATPERLRKDMPFRAAIKEQLESVKGAVAAMVGTENKRKFSLED